MLFDTARNDELLPPSQLIKTFFERLIKYRENDIYILVPLLVH